MAKSKKEEISNVDITTETVVKKSRSGKRKPKVEINDLESITLKKEIIEEINSEVEAITLENADSNIQIAVAIDAEILDEALKLSSDKSKVELGHQAKQWLLFLERCQITPEEWLKRYPTNKFKHLVEEIVLFNAQK